MSEVFQQHLPQGISMTRVILFLILLLPLTLASPTLLAAVPVSIDTGGDGIEKNQDADDDGKRL
tara:strand:+ start:78 stop:269 length:192 start_codon:yes stop_codon:yes gene_type:complete